MPPRYIGNNAPPLLRVPNPRHELITSLTKIVQGCPPQKPWTDPFKGKGVGLWTGPTAIAYLFLWLSETHPELLIDGKKPRDWCLRYLDCGSEDITSAQDLNGWAVKNEYLAYSVVKAAATQDPAYVSRFVKALATDFNCPDVDNEHLVGRAGTLALLRILESWCPFAKDDVARCTAPLIKDIMKAVPWRFHGHNYIGAAHGVIGIVTQVILSDHAMGQDETMEKILDEQLRLQADDGHWFITDDPNLGDSDLVHYCHGAPGFVVSLLAIKPFVASEFQQRIDTAVELGRKNVWEKGLLTKEPNLCHGIVGNMLALGDWEERQHFMAHATADYIDVAIKEGKYIAGDDPYGLYWGGAGRAWGWMMIDSKRDLGYPSYTDI